MVLKPYVFIPKNGEKTYTYTDTEVSAGTTYRYSITPVQFDGTDYFYDQDYRECYMGHYLSYPEFVPAASILFDYDSDTLSMKSGEEKEINALIHPEIPEGTSEEEAEKIEPTFKDVYWKIDDESVASIVTDKNKVTVKALKSGQTVLGAYTTDGSNVLKRVNIVVELLDITKATAVYEQNQIYTGRAIEPEVTVKIGDEVLTKDIDYKVSYKNNISVGMAKMIVTGIGKYGGQKTLEFNIKVSETEPTIIIEPTVTTEPTITAEPTITVEPTVTINPTTTIAPTVSAKPTKQAEKQDTSVKKISKTTVKTAVTTKNGIKISWKQVKNATGYRIYRKTGKGKYKVIKVVKNGKTTSLIDKRISKKSVYVYKVRAYRGKTIGKDSNRITARYLSTPKLTSVKKSEKQIKLTWNKVKGAKGYKVYRRTDNGKYKLVAKIKNSSKLSYTDSKIKSQSVYTYKIVAYYKNSLSTYSKAKKVK